MKTNNLILIMSILSIGACKKQYQYQYKYNNPNELIECKYNKDLTCEAKDEITLANGSAINTDYTQIAFFINGKLVATESYHNTNNTRMIRDISNNLFYIYHKNEKLSHIGCKLTEIGSKSSIYVFDKKAEEFLKKTKGNLTCEKLYEYKFKEKWSI